MDFPNLGECQPHFVSSNPSSSSAGPLSLGDIDLKQLCEFVKEQI